MQQVSPVLQMVDERCECSVVDRVYDACRGGGGGAGRVGFDRRRRSMLLLLTDHGECELFVVADG